MTTEEEYFPPPPELRELLRGLETALSLLDGAPRRSDSPLVGRVRRPALADDRDVAADVLDVLAGLDPACRQAVDPTRNRAR